MLPPALTPPTHRSSASSNPVSPREIITSFTISNTYTYLLSSPRTIRYAVPMSPGDRLQRLEGLDIATMSAADAIDALRDLSVIRGRTDQFEAAIARRIAELHDSGSAAPAADVLVRQSHSSRRAAEKAERRADALGSTPELDQALGDGRVGIEHADAVAAAAGRLEHDQRTALFERDEEITELATTHSPETFRRRLGKLVDDITGDDGIERAARQDAAASANMKIDDDTGMHRLFAEFTPEQGNRIRTELDHEMAALSRLPEFAGLRREQLRVRALERLICGTRVSTGLGPPQVGVMIDLPSLLTGAHVDTLCEYFDGTRIPVETARRHACDAGIIPIVLGGDGVPLDVGRSKRLATKEQRIALRSMYRSCAVDGCDHHFDLCHIHHLIEWEFLGDTDLENLLPLCSFHHHKVHEGRWRLQLDPSTRQLDVFLPDGSLLCTSRPDLLADRLAA